VPKNGVAPGKTDKPGDFEGENYFNLDDIIRGLEGNAIELYLFSLPSLGIPL
jgi:hypothetical protein